MTDTEKHERLLRELLAKYDECEWFEYKHNKYTPEIVGQYISALANSAALRGEPKAYMVWGVDDTTKSFAETEFNPRAMKQGNQNFILWLQHRLSPKINFDFYNLEIENKHVVLLEVSAAEYTPVSFNDVEYVRIDSCKTLLKSLPEKQKTLWRLLERHCFEECNALEGISADEVLQLLYYSKYFDILKIPMPAGRTGVLCALHNDELISPNLDGTWNIRNLGAILFAKQLRDFPTLRRKTVRVIFYSGNNKIETKQEVEYSAGYACCFEDMVGYINGMLPRNEILTSALRKDTAMFPPIAIRELVANALIHQDFWQSGTNPMIEVFEDRVEIINSGKPLIDVRRFLDSPPKSRNENLASFMRRLGVCEERGSGIDKVAIDTELYQLPAPLFETPTDFTKATLFSHQDFEDMSKSDKIRSCYVHCVLRYITNKRMDNKSLRERFCLDTKQSYTVTRVIKWAVEANLIIDASGTDSRKFKNYIPYWAEGETL